MTFLQLRVCSVVPNLGMTACFQLVTKRNRLFQLSITQCLIACENYAVAACAGSMIGAGMGISFSMPCMLSFSQIILYWFDFWFTLISASLMLSNCSLVMPMRCRNSDA